MPKEFTDYDPDAFEASNYHDDDFMAGYHKKRKLPKCLCYDWDAPLVRCKCKECGKMFSAHHEKEVCVSCHNELFETRS